MAFCVINILINSTFNNKMGQKHILNCNFINFGVKINI